MHSRQVEGLFSAHSMQPLSQRMSRTRLFMLMSPLPLLSLLLLRELQLSRPVQLEQKKGKEGRRHRLGRNLSCRCCKLLSYRCQERRKSSRGAWDAKSL